MFFILNNENAVLAADDAFLESVGTTHIFLLAERFRFGDFQLDEENRTCLISGKTRTFTKSSIQTILGGGSLYRIDEEAPEVLSEDTGDETDKDVTLSTAIPVSEQDVPPHETAEETGEADTASLETPDQPEVSTSSQQEIPDLPEPETILSAVAPDLPETPEPEALVSKTDTLTLSTPDLPEAFEPEEDDLLAILDDEAAPAAEAEDVALPDWLETQNEPAESEAPELAVSEPQRHAEEDLPDLLNLEEEKTPTVEHTTPPLEEEAESDLLEIRDEPDTSNVRESAIPESKEHEEEDLLDLLDLDEEGPTAPSITSSPTPAHEAEEDLFDLLDMDEENKAPASSTTETRTSATPPPLDDILSLKDEGSIPDDNAALSLKEEPTPPESTVHVGIHQIGDAPLADYHANAKVIGITSDEYLGFLRQFTDESLQYKAGLKSNDLYLFKKNLLSIKDASQLLHLPQLSQTLEQLEESTSEEREQLIDRFYDMVQHIRRDLDQDTVPSAEQSQPEPVAESKPESPEAPPPEAPSFSFDSVEPIPFDFSAKAASDELGLPESLVQEFVSDFVQQARENISVFEEAQRTNDIDTIQKTAHLLKGAASNLRIDPLAETLKALQYNESPSAVPELFQTFVGQLKTLVQFTEN